MWAEVGWREEGLSAETGLIEGRPRFYTGERKYLKDKSSRFSIPPEIYNHDQHKLNQMIQRDLQIVSNDMTAHDELWTQVRRIWRFSASTI